MDMVALDLIQRYSAQFLVSDKLVQAICQTESGLNPYRSRFEPAWTYFYYPITYATKLQITLDTEKNQQATSWGYMQVMGSVARELGFDDLLTKLCIPQNGLFFGIKKLGQLHERYKVLDELIASYNAGTPRKLDNGQWANQKYVDSVLGNLTKIR